NGSTGPHRRALRGVKCRREHREKAFCPSRCGLASLLPFSPRNSRLPLSEGIDDLLNFFVNSLIIKNTHATHPQVEEFDEIVGLRPDLKILECINKILVV